MRDDMAVGHNLFIFLFLWWGWQTMGAQKGALEFWWGFVEFKEVLFGDDSKRS